MTDQLAVPTWREEARRDRLTRAQIDQERETARLRLRIDGRRAELAVRREERQARDADRQAARQARAAGRQQARKARAARRERRLAWLREHSTDLLFVPVIAVPAVLAWTAMAAFGVQVYGGVGLTLPAFSEGAMWAFAGAVTLTRHRHPGKPVWHLRLGTAVFAAEGAALNFAHGMTASVGGLPPGPGVGAVMAVVSVAGVTAHQLVTAGPRRSRAERAADRLHRARERREVRARRDAIRRATAVLDADGSVRLVCQPRPVTARRRRWAARLTRRDRAQQAALTPGPSCPWPQPVPVILPAPAPVTAARGGAPDGRTRTAPAPGRTRTRARTRGAAAARTRAVTDESAEVHYAAELADGRVPSRRRIKLELHVGQDRAAQIHDHLTAVATPPRQPSGRTT